MIYASLYYIAGVVVSYFETRAFGRRLAVTYPGVPSRLSRRTWAELLLLGGIAWPVVLVADQFIPTPVGRRHP